MADTEPTPTESTPDPETNPTPDPTPEPTPEPEPTAAPTPAPAGSTVNRNKYERDLGKAKAENDQLKAELEGYKGLKAEFEEWKASQEQAETDSALKKAGCHDTVAARARLSEFDGDIDKLKEAAPYLFNSTANDKGTGGNPKGNPSAEDERNKHMRELMGLKTK